METKAQPLKSTKTSNITTKNTTHRQCRKKASPQDSYSVLVLEFQQDDIEEGLHAIEAAVNVISHEQVIGILKLSRKYG